MLYTKKYLYNSTIAAHTMLAKLPLPLSSFFILKCFNTAFLLLKFVFVFFWWKNIGKKMLLKCWWNWQQFCIKPHPILRLTRAIMNWFRDSGIEYKGRHTFLGLSYFLSQVGYELAPSSARPPVYSDHLFGVPVLVCIT
jgi:hypothetical protein